MSKQENTNKHFADRLLDAISDKGSPVCVGIDPNPSMIPAEFISNDPTETLDGISRWALSVLEIVAPYVPSVKPQIAYFEALGGSEAFAGLGVYDKVVTRARELGLIVIGDAKRGDIGTTAAAYALPHLAAPNAPDALTVNGYFGADGLNPFIEAGNNTGRGIFVLVRTSNPSAPSVQDFTDASGKRFYEHIAELVAQVGDGDECIGSCGYSNVGAVVGATYPDEARQLREIMPQQIFLVPGYGAQGATSDDCAASFKHDGTGAIVNASRSVIYAHRRDEFKAQSLDWKKCVELAAKEFANDIAQAVAAK
ncbi:MAG: orotidine-5'-phosphate decarboxylase [Phycisphaerae bacterium]|nr:orotidine-5'-phosphate decarboxylase [Phycisphaerae bacterium]